MEDQYADSPREVWVPVKRQSKQRPFLLILLFVGAGALFMGCLLAATAVGGLFYASEMVLPGVRVLGVDIGLQQQAEAAALLSEHWQQQSIFLEDETGSWPLSPTALGLTLDAAATVRQAYLQSRSLAGWQALAANGLQVQPLWSYDPATAEKQLQTLAPQLYISPVEAAASVASGEVQVNAAVDGRALDVAATLNELNQSPAAVLSNGRLPLITKAVAPMVTDVTAVAAEATQLLSAPITIRAYDPVQDEAQTWSIAPAVWGDWLILQNSSGTEAASTWAIEPQAAADYLALLMSDLGAQRYLAVDEVALAMGTAVGSPRRSDDYLIETRIYHHPRQHVVQAGESMASIGRRYGIPYPWVQQANPDVFNLVPGQTITIPSADDMLPMPVVADKRVVVSISEQRTWVYENGQLKWDWPASTGIDSSPTSPGIFQIQTHFPSAYASNWDLDMPSFMGVYRPIPTSDFMNGFHGFPTRGNSQLLWTGDLGHQVTYGCILLSSENATTLYNWAEEGVVVEIKP